MKKQVILPIIIAVVFMALIFFVLFVSRISSCFDASESETYIDPKYKFELAEYDLTYDVESNCKIAVTEEITVDYLGYLSTGFIRDIPVNAGTQVRNVKVKKLAGDSPSFWYGVDYEYSNFVSVDIGDSSGKYLKTEKYLLTYDYVITNKVVKKSLLPLNVIGHGWACEINDASVTLNLPAGFKSAKCYYGKSGATNEFNGFTLTEANGKTSIQAKFDTLAPFNGVTFDLQFEKGAIKNNADVLPYVFLVAVALIFGAALAAKLTVFNKVHLLTVVNYSAPDKMSPLLMGKLIDNRIDSEDITSMIYYWASKGYIKINFDDQKDPTLIRITKSLPQGTPDYERELYDGLFEKGDVVKPSQLKNKYYRHIDSAKTKLNSSVKNLYDKRSIVFAVVIAVICGLVLGVAPLVLAITRISNTLLYLFGIFMVIPAFVVNFLVQTLMVNRHKISKSTFITFAVLIGALCVAVSLFYLMTPQGIMTTAAKVLLALACMGTAAFSGTLISRTKEYNERLGDVLGFKQFIELAEKDRLEMMLEEDPQLYYEILPYAQVLGVSEKWEEKFEDITLQPPQWATGDVVSDIITYHMFNRIISNSMRGMTTNIISRPSSSGLSGGGFHGGGFGGGFSGGGFGGGGGRGR